MQPSPFTSEHEYLVLDAQAPDGVRLEYLDGTVYLGGQPYLPGLVEAMAGETYEHAVVKDNVRDALQRRLKAGCRALTAGMKVRAPGHGRGGYVYPDVFVLGGPPELDETQKPPVLLNPLLVVEVLSPSTQVHDYVTKERAYFRVPSVQEYWIVDPERPLVRQLVRRPDGVLRRDDERAPDAEALGTLRSEVLDLDVPIAEFYGGLDGVV